MIHILTIFAWHLIKRQFSRRKLKHQLRDPFFIQINGFLLINLIIEPGSNDVVKCELINDGPYIGLVSIPQIYTVAGKI